MADYSVQRPGVDLNFTKVQAQRTQQTEFASAPVSAPDYRYAAQAISDLVGFGARMYGKNAAKKAGEEIGTGGETHEEADSAVIASEEQLLFRKQQREAEGGELTEAQALDLKEEVFSATLTSQRRIERARARGLISSAEANARLGVLRSKALANPLVAPFAQELDDAMYRVTGGAGGVVKNGERVFFGPTAREEEAAAIREGELKAIEAEQKAATEMVRVGAASSENQARSILSELKDMETEMKRLELRKSQLGWTSEEAFASSEIRLTGVATQGYGLIAEWMAGGGSAEAVPALRQNLSEVAMATKEQIRRDAYGPDGRLLVNSATLRSQLSAVDDLLATYDDMLEDQSATKRILDIMAERQSLMDTRNQSIQLDLMTQMPVVYALKDTSGLPWLLDKITGTNDMGAMFLEARNPVLRAIGETHGKFANHALADGLKDFLNGVPLAEGTGEEVAPPTRGDANDSGFFKRAALALGLKSGGGGNIIREAVEKNPAVAFDTLASLPLTAEDMRYGSTFASLLSTGKEEDLEAVRAAIDGAAQRTVAQELINRGRRRETAEEAAARGSKRRKWAVPSFETPKRVAISKKPAIGPGMRTTYAIDTGGVKVSDEFKAELAHTFEMGSAHPQLWQGEFATINDWLTSMYGVEGGEE